MKRFMVCLLFVFILCSCSTIATLRDIPKTDQQVVDQKAREINALCVKYWNIICIRFSLVDGEALIADIDSGVCAKSKRDYDEMVGIILARDGDTFHDLGIRKLKLFVDSRFHKEYTVFKYE